MANTKYVDEIQVKSVTYELRDTGARTLIADNTTELDAIKNKIPSSASSSNQLVSSTDLESSLLSKVDVITGKTLSTNDFTTELKEKLEGLIVDTALDSTSENLVQNKVVYTALSNKVDKVDGKQLSTNDFTDEDKTKLESLTNYDDSSLIEQINNKVDKVEGKSLSTNDFTTTEKTKLAGIESGAQVNIVTGVKGSSEIDYRIGNINISKANIGLGNVSNESKETMFTSPAFTGTPTAPTATAGTSTTQLATTAFVSNAINALDVTSVGGINKYISAISETNGKISATAGTVDTTVTANSSNLITSGAVKAAIDALPEPMVFKGSLGTGGTITSLPTAATANKGYTYKVITAGTYANTKAKIGDLFVSDGISWVYIPSADEPSGTVTSVGISVPTGLSVSSSPVTSSGTIAISYASGYSIPTTAKQANWDTAYSWGNHASEGYLTGITKAQVTTALGYTPPTTNTTYSVATTSTNGLMSATDKSKLDNIAEGANNYSLPTASSSTLGGVKTTSNVTSATGLTACPIISGVPYYKDTNTTYSAGTGISLSGTTFSNSGVRSISSGSTNGTISVNTNGTSAEVAVKGLGSAAYTASTTYAAASHGTHVTYSTTAPKALGTAAVGTASSVARSDHVHPTPTSLSLTSLSLNGWSISIV